MIFFMWIEKWVLKCDMIFFMVEKRNKVIIYLIDLVNIYNDCMRKSLESL